MLNIKDIDKEIIFEAVVERHILKLLQELKKNKTTLDEFFLHRIPMLEQIDASCITVYRRLSDEVKKHCTKVFKNDDKEYDETILIFLKDGEILGGYYKSNILYLFDNNIQYYHQKRNASKLYNCMDDKQKKFIHRKDWIYPIATVCDEIWEIDASGLDTMSMKDTRRQAKDGMILMNDKSFKRIAEENIKRYKILAQEIRQKKGESFNAVYQVAMELISEGMGICKDFHDNLEYWFGSENTPRVVTGNTLSGIVKGINNSVCNLLQKIQDAMDNETEVVKNRNNSFGSWSRDYHTSQIDKKNKIIKDYSDDLKKRIDLYKETKGEL